MSLSGVAAYLTGLSENNNKAWFEANRAAYAELRAEFTDCVADVIAQTAAFDPDVAHVQAKDALFRINRDLRFSKDKSPYKTTFSASFGPGGRGPGGAGYYFQIDAKGELHGGGGHYQPDSATLGRLRDSIVRDPEAFAAVIRAPDFVRVFGKINGERLKRLPAGVPANALFPEELKLTGFWVGTTHDVRESTWSDAATTIATTYQMMQPFMAWLREASS